jgi:hypothetical protein
VLIFLLFASFSTAVADESLMRAEVRSLWKHPLFDLRVGFMSVDELAPEQAPYMCGAVNPLSWLSVEACGNGAGILHQKDIADFAHFRLRAETVKLTEGRVETALMTGVGFAEVQRSADAPGFRFGGAESGQVEAAGPEVSMGVRMRMWSSNQVYMVVDADAGLAHIPGAPEVMGAQDAHVPFGALTIGMGL